MNSVIFLVLLRLIQRLYFASMKLTYMYKHVILLPFFTNMIMRASIQRFAAVCAFTLSVGLPLLVHAQSTPQTNNAECYGYGVQTTVTPGQTFYGNAVLRNSGTSTWLPGTVMLGSRNPALIAPSTVWGVSMVNLPPNSKVLPGYVISIPIKSVAPTVQGSYAYYWQMMVPGTTPVWFGQQCKTTIVVKAPLSADVSIMKTGPQTISKGTDITYNITVRNAGPSAALNLTILDKIPAGLVYKPQPTGPTCFSMQGGSLACNILSLQSGQQVSFPLVFSTASVTCGATLTNTAKAYNPMFDPNQANNTSATVTTNVTCAPSCTLNSLPPAVQDFVNAGYVTLAEACANIGKNAVRKDFIKLVVELNGGILSGPPSTPSFDDVPLSHSHFGWYEESGKEGWIRGDNNCYGIHPCFEHPENTLIRGYFALVAQRSFGLTVTGAAPQFLDNPAGNDTATALQAAGDHCALLPDATGQYISPNGVMLFEDMLAALKRIDQGNLQWGRDCGTQVAASQLFITGKSLASNDTLVANQKNVPLLRFEGRAQNGDILLTQTAFSVAQGSLTNGQNYTLWVDTNNDAVVDTILQKNVSPISGTITFNALAGGGYVVPNNTSVIFEVHTDVAASLASSTLQLQFSTGQSYIAAETLSNGADLSGIKTDGICPSTCQITVTTATSTVFTIRSQGDLYITKSSTPVRSRQLLGGTLSEEILRLQLHAEYEDIDVTNLVFTSEAPDESLFSSNVDRLELYKVGEVTPFATATVAGCATDPVPSNSMCARMLNAELIVLKGSNMNILVRPRMRTDSAGAISGKHVKLRLDAVAGAKARGFISSNNLTQNDGDALSEGEVFIGTSSNAASQTITGNDNVVVLSKITSILNANPDANGTAIPTGVQRAIGQFKFRAEAANNTLNGQNKWTLSDIIFNVNVTNVATNLGSYKIYNKADPFSKASCSVTTISASQLLAVCDNLTLSSVNTQIDQGSDSTFVLETEVTNPQVSSSASSILQVSLQNFGSITNTTFGASSSHLQWQDKDFGASTPFLWIESPETTINSTQYQN